MSRGCVPRRCAPLRGAFNLCNGRCAPVPQHRKLAGGDGVSVLRRDPRRTAHSDPRRTPAAMIPHGRRSRAVGRREAGDADFFLAATCQIMSDIAIIGDAVASPSNVCARQRLAQNSWPSQTQGASQRCARRPRQNHGLENRPFQPRLVRWSPRSHRKISCSPMVCREPVPACACKPARL